jgi:hypothetical protein
MFVSKFSSCPNQWETSCPQTPGRNHSHRARNLFFYTVRDEQKHTKKNKNICVHKYISRRNSVFQRVDKSGAFFYFMLIALCKVENWMMKKVKLSKMWRSGGIAPPFLTSAVDGDEWSASHPPGKSPGTH